MPVLKEAFGVVLSHNQLIQWDLLVSELCCHIVLQL